MTASAWHPGQDSLDRTIGASQSGQVGCKGQKASPTDHVNLEKSERRGWPGKDSTDRTGGTGQPGQDNCGRTVSRTAGAGSVQDSWDRTEIRQSEHEVWTGQRGQENWGT
jgi:hypothetical protein